MAEWIKICNQSHLKKGEMVPFDHNDKKLMVVNLGGKIYATERICTHADADLTTGILNEDGVTCPLHLSIFNLQTGIPQNLPAEKPLKTYNVKIEQNEIYVEVG